MSPLKIQINTINVRSIKFKIKTRFYNKIHKFNIKDILMTQINIYKKVTNNSIISK